MIHPLPVAHPEQLVEFLQDLPGQPRSAEYWDWASYQHFRTNSHVLSALTGTSFDNLASVRIGHSDPETVIEENVVGNYFQTLGLKPAVGRLISPGDVPASGAGDVAVVSWSYWNTRLHRDPAILGKRIYVGEEGKTIIGVAPRGYDGPRVGSRTDIWIPQEDRSLTMIGRLKPGVTLQRAQAEMAVLYRFTKEQKAFGSKNPRVWEARVEVEPAGAGLARVRDQYGKPLLLLLVIVLLLLLLTCINLASMLLARSAGRQEELAVRVGLGASRRQLVGQMLTESLLLSAAGTLAGVLLAYLGTGVVARIMAGGRAFEHIEIEVQLDVHLLLFTAVICVLTGLLFGSAPTWYAFRSVSFSDLRQSGSRCNTKFRRVCGRGLVIAQIALSISLVTSAVAFLSHLSQLRNPDLGFRSDHVLLVTLDPSHSGYKSEQLAVRYQQLVPRLQAIPGVHSVSISGCTPLEGCGSGSRYLIAEGHAERAESRLRTPVVFVSPRYFETLGIPLLAGRDFSFRDVDRSRVAIVSQAMARHYFLGENPIGKHVRIDTDPRTGGWFGDNNFYEIVGLVGDVKAFEIRDPPAPAMYFNMFQENRLFDQFELRTSVDPISVSGPVRQVFQDVIKGVPANRLTTLADQVNSNIVPERLMASLSEYFGLLGAVLAGIGLYGLLAYTVVTRTNEIGVRMALGATTGNVSRLVLRDLLQIVCAGLLGGASIVFMIRPLAASLIHDLKSTSSIPLAVGSGAIVIVALLASYVPVRRAASIDPIAAIRHD